jgi:hypothetical protein
MRTSSASFSGGTCGSPFSGAAIFSTMPLAASAPPALAPAAAAGPAAPAAALAPSAQSKAFQHCIVLRYLVVEKPNSPWTGGGAYFSNAPFSAVHALPITD